MRLRQREFKYSAASEMMLMVVISKHHLKRKKVRRTMNERLQSSKLKNHTEQERSQMHWSISRIFSNHCFEGLRGLQSSSIFQQLPHTTVHNVASVMWAFASHVPVTLTCYDPVPVLKVVLYDNKFRLTS